MTLVICFCTSDKIQTATSANVTTLNNQQLTSYKPTEIFMTFSLDRHNKVVYTNNSQVSS